MSIARQAIERPLYTWLLILFCIFGGIGGYLSVGKLEDPGITLKSALVVTSLARRDGGRTGGRSSPRCWKARSRPWAKSITSPRATRPACR